MNRFIAIGVLLVVDTQIACAFPAVERAYVFPSAPPAALGACTQYRSGLVERANAAYEARVSLSWIAAGLSLASAVSLAFVDGPDRSARQQNWAIALSGASAVVGGGVAYMSLDSILSSAMQEIGALDARVSAATSLSSEADQSRAFYAACMGGAGTLATNLPKMVRDAMVAADSASCGADGKCKVSLPPGWTPTGKTDVTISKTDLNEIIATLKNAGATTEVKQQALDRLYTGQ